MPSARRGGAETDRSRVRAGERLVGFGAADLPRGTLTLLGGGEVAGALDDTLRSHARTWRRRVA